MHLRSHGHQEQLQNIPEIEVYARRRNAVRAQQNRVEESNSSTSSEFSENPTDFTEISLANSDTETSESMEEEEAQPPLPTLGSYVIPQGPRNIDPIVLSTVAKELEIKPLWYTWMELNAFSGKNHEDPHGFLERLYKKVNAEPDEEYDPLYH